MKWDLFEGIIPPEASIDRAVKEAATKLAKAREQIVIDLMLRGVGITEMTWVTDTDKKEWLCAPGYRIPAPTYRFEGHSIIIDAWCLKDAPDLKL